MAGLPVACSEFPEMKRIVEENKVGATFDPENPKDIARAIKEIFADGNKYEKMRSRALRVAKATYNWEIEERKLLKVYIGLN